MKNLRSLLVSSIALVLSVALVAIIFGAQPALLLSLSILAVAGALFAPSYALGVNSYTNLVADFYKAMDVVSRELVGFIPAVARDSTAERCALNANAVRSGVAPINSALGNVTPAMALPSAAYQTIGNKGLQITKSRFAPFSWTGEDRVALESGGQFLTIKQNQIAQAIRALVNEVESDVATAAYKGASRFYGTVGTTPFASSLAATAQVRKILADNGAPMSDLHLVMDTTAGAALRTLTQLTKVNEAGESGLLRQGVLMNVHGFNLRESAQVVSPTVGTGATLKTDNTGYAIGATTITLKATGGTGTIVAGDVITFAGDTNKYVVATGDADASDGGTVVLQEPGLRKAIAASEIDITILATGPRNVGFDRNAIQLATRLPALPEEGDLADFREVITDDRSGLSFELAAYKGFRMVTYHVSIAWGQVVVKPEHVAGLLG